MNNLQRQPLSKPIRSTRLHRDLQRYGLRVVKTENNHLNMGYRPEDVLLQLIRRVHQPDFKKPKKPKRAILPGERPLTTMQAELLPKIGKDWAAPPRHASGQSLRALVKRGLIEIRAVEYWQHAFCKPAYNNRSAWEFRLTQPKEPQ